MMSALDTFFSSREEIGRCLNFQRLFGSDSPPTVVSESLGLREFATSLEMAVMGIEEVLDNPPAAILFVPANWQLLRPHFTSVLEAFGVSRVLTAPVHAFDGSDDAAIYTLSRLLDSNIEMALVGGRLWQSRLQGNQGRLMFRSASSYLELKTSLSPRLNFRCQPEIAIGQQAAVSNYLEAEMEALYSELRPFVVNGFVEVKAMLAAKQAYLPRECHAKFSRAQQFVREINISGERIWLEVRDNVIKKFLVGNTDYLSTLDEFTNDVYGLTLTEFAFGLNRSIRDTVDWSINSIVNEGVSPIHLGVGDGFTGVHMDIICDDITEWTGPTEEGWQPLFNESFDGNNR